MKSWLFIALAAATLFGCAPLRPLVDVDHMEAADLLRERRRHESDREDARHFQPYTSTVAAQNVHLERELGQEERAALRNGTYRDGRGRISGSASTFEGNTTYRDGSGRISGSAYQSPSGTTTFRDGSGRITGNASTFEGHTTFRDGSGRISGTASVSGDTTTYRDGNGRITGTAYKSPAGTITYRDADGRIIGSAPAQ